MISDPVSFFFGSPQLDESSSTQLNSYSWVQQVDPHIRIPGFSRLEAPDRSGARYTTTPTGNNEMGDVDWSGLYLARFLRWKKKRTRSSQKPIGHGYWSLRFGGAPCARWVLHSRRGSLRAQFDLTAGLEVAGPHCPSICLLHS